MGKDTDELFSELTKAKTDRELKTFYERNEEELQHPDAVACLEQLFAKHKLKKADVILNTGLERTFAYHLLAGRKTFTRDKLLIFAIAAQLTIEETQTLLKYAGEGKLYARDARDGMVIHASWTYGKQTNCSGKWTCRNLCWQGEKKTPTLCRRNGRIVQSIIF